MSYAQVDLLFEPSYFTLFLVLSQDLLWRRRHLQWDAIFNLAQAVEENLADMDMGYYQHLMVSKKNLQENAIISVTSRPLRIRTR